MCTLNISEHKLVVCVVWAVVKGSGISFILRGLNGLLKGSAMCDKGK